MAYIEKLYGLEILDSRGNPTIEVHLHTSDGDHVKAAVPSGIAARARPGGFVLLTKGASSGRKPRLFQHSQYKLFLKEIKERILSSQVKAAVAVNREVVALYWEIGSALRIKQQAAGWGSKIVAKLAGDLKSSFPDMKGFSLTYIKYMIQFAKEYPDFKISQQLVGQIPFRC